MDQKRRRKQPRMHQGKSKVRTLMNYLSAYRRTKRYNVFAEVILKVTDTVLSN